MRILHVITSLRIGGAEKLMVDLLPRLRDMGHDVDLLLFDGTMTSFRQQLESADIRVYDLGVGGSVYSPIKLFKLIPYLKKYDIIHTHNTAPQLFAAIGNLICSTTLCTTEHTTSNHRRALKWYAPIDRWMYRRYKKIISISPKTEESLKQYVKINDSRFLTIFNGIDLAKYTISDKIKLITEQDVFAIVQVAGFRYEKDQDTVISALKYLPEKFHLFLVGDGERRIILENLVRKLDLEARVHFLGIRDDVPKILSSADIVVMSSHWEGFGLAAVEGMAAGKPVLASDVEGLRDIVNGAGILFPHQDSKILADEIIKIESDPLFYKEVMGKCIQRAKHFDISKMVKGYLKVYESI